MIITDRGKPACVLVRYEEYRRLSGGKPWIRELFDLPGTEGVEFEAPRMGADIFRPADLG